MHILQKRFRGTADELLEWKDRDDLERAVEAMAQYQNTRYSDWPRFMRALVWHEFGSGRLDIDYYNEAYETMTEDMSCNDIPLSRDDELRLFLSFVKHSYLRSLHTPEGVVDELEDFLFFLTHHLPTYRKFLEHFELSWFNAYAYTQLAEGKLENGVFKVTFKDMDVQPPEHLYTWIKDWKMFTGPKSLSLHPHYDYEAFDEKRRALVDKKANQPTE
ncbi:ORF15 [Ranid herpesvirus 2]|uniref:ORF15 n=1 Tax=Ranid herpesvirus 2 TaxID=389214 RepID=Q14W91_9VIRU|nr:ORF15 [Ranid herpesvirus 2]ABG25675.1 ORF15 [Ranid herpesvirus 2]